MPIRFRCVYCNQLLGISRRKAGCIVRCTKCEGQLIVPDAGAAVIETNGADGAPVPVKTDPGEGGGLFEREDFDALLQPYQAPAVKSAVAAPPPPHQPLHPATQERAPAAPHSPAPLPTASLTVSRRQLTIASVVIVLAVGFAFACGMWVGLAMK